MIVVIYGHRGHSEDLGVWRFFFNDTATTEIYTLSLHDALPIYPLLGRQRVQHHEEGEPDRLVADHHVQRVRTGGRRRDRKSTRLNSSHANISYAVFCLKKKSNAIGRALACCHLTQVSIMLSCHL